MNKYFILPALFFTLFIVAQEETKKPSINDFDFESVSNPALLLLDETPSYINTPYNFRSLALYLSSGFSNSNVALELSPYWVVGNNDTSYRDYRGIRVKGDGLSINPFKALYRNLTFSAGYLAKQFDGFPDEKRTVSLGARTTFIEVYGKKRTAQVVDVLSAIESDMEDEALNAFIEFFVRLDIMKVDENICAHKDEKKQEYLAAAKSFLERNPQYTDRFNAEYLVDYYFSSACAAMEAFYYNPQTIKPIFRMDGAIAYSLLFKENSIDAQTANRLGGWVTADLALDLPHGGYFHLLAIGKYINDGFLVLDDGGYTTKTFWDYGGKVSFELRKFQFSYEYIHRQGSLEMYRSVGNVTYQLSPQMSLTTGFGKDFPQENNLMTLLGLNWSPKLAMKGFKK